MMQNNNFLKKILILIPLLVVLSCLVTYPNQGFADDATVTILGEVQNYDLPLGIVVYDPSLAGSGEVSVSVTTTSDPTGVTLVLRERDGEPGYFDNIDDDTFQGNLWLMKGDYKFPTRTTITLNYSDDPFYIAYDPSFPDSVILFPSSSGGPPPDPFFLTETGDDTGIFEGQVRFSSSGSSGVNLFNIKAGDVFHIRPACGGAVNGQITPAPLNTPQKVVEAVLGDTITATYKDSSHTDTAIISSDASGGCGGSGGGLIISRIVLDLLAGGTSGGDFLPPQITIPKLNLSNLPLVSDVLNFLSNADPFTPIPPLDEPSIDYPISINGNGYLLTQYANTIQTYQGKTGEPVSFKMTLFDATGVEHIGLYTNLRGDHREIQNSDTFLIYSEGKPLELTDPHAFFSNVNFTESENNGKYIAEFNMTFARPMDTSDIIIRSWDERLNSGDIKVFDAFRIEGEPILPDTNDLIVPDSADIVVPYYKMSHYEIPNTDSDGNLVYYNSFGGLEEKQTHPQSIPIVYPNYIGRDERHDYGYYEKVTKEESKAQTKTQSIISESTYFIDDNKKDMKFFYPSNVGKLDRENKDILKNLVIQENLKASKIFNKKYHTNQILD